ncbi:MAG: motility associated factor glycosyltransferase family protein [Rhodospirillales bacterium]|nr:motility associated factor glycosyltransferase family protein [Rhodospirillales bacterium]
MATVHSQQMFERNMEMFQERVPVLYNFLKNFHPEGSLTTLDNGETDLVAGGNPIFGGRHDAYFDQMVEQYWRHPARLGLAHPNPNMGDDEAGRFIGNLTEACGKADVKISDGLTAQKSFFLIILGIGLGAHIDRMVEQSGCHTLVLVEPVPEMIYHSLFTYDWAALYKAFDDSGRRIEIVCDPNVANTCTGIKLALRGDNACAMDGGYYVKALDNPFNNDVVSRLGNELVDVFNDLGSYYDETLMIRNAYANLSAGHSRLYKSSPPDRELDMPVFLCGSGPSLDGAIDLIKENQDQAVIVSVGTALQPLLKNGIVPDFQVESENFYPDFDDIYAYLQGAAETQRIHLVAAVTCPEEIIRCFGSATLYFRDGQTPRYLFNPPDSATLIGSSPAVGNAGLSFAQWSGFRRFYFFGMDLGARNPDRHHAVGSMGLVLQDFSIEMPANFGGTVMTTIIFYDSLTGFREAIHQLSDGREYFNCSDGCFIEGAEPLHLADVDLPPATAAKADVVRQLRDDSSSYPVSEVQTRLGVSVVI